MRRRKREVPAIPLAVVLLPSKLDESPQRERIEALLRSPGAVAVEPPAIGYGARPGLLRQGLPAGHAKRMSLPGQPRAIGVFDARQYPLARALLAENPEAELWYGGRTGGALHEAAQARATLRFEAEGGAPVRERNRPLHERMEALGIESGRLGSERV